MNRNIQDLRLRLGAARMEVQELEGKLSAAVRSCNHRWGAITDASIRHEAYTIPGDPPGTMGVDRQLPCYVEAKTEARWKRVCQECGEIEYTTRTRQIVAHEPEF